VHPPELLLNVLTSSPFLHWYKGTLHVTALHAVETNAPRQRTERPETHIFPSPLWPCVHRAPAPHEKYPQLCRKATLDGASSAIRRPPRSLSARRRRRNFRSGSAVCTARRPSAGICSRLGQTGLSRISFRNKVVFTLEKWMFVLSRHINVSCDGPRSLHAWILQRRTEQPVLAVLEDVTPPGEVCELRHVPFQPPAAHRRLAANHIAGTRL
jgi:hypothetical protein